MQCQTPDQLAGKKCVPCEGGVPKYSRAQAEEQLTCLSGWQLTHDGLRIRKDWTVKNFLAGLEFINSVAKVAEAEDHHPDLHLESYRKLWIEIWTHAIGGLSENDFILAAKIDRLPIQLKKSDQKFARSLVEKRPMAQVLVTGASGFIGKQLVAALVARGDDVTCLVRPTSVVESLQNLGARLAIGDVTEPASLPAALASVDAVYHLAGVTKANTYADYCTINEAGVHNVVEACARRTTPPVLLLVSSLAAAGPTLDTNHLRTEVEPPRPRSRYGRSKRAGEQAAESARR